MDRCWPCWGNMFLRARIRAPVLGVLFFAVTSVTADGVENTSSSQKRRVVLQKVTCGFVENNVSFYGKQRVVFDWRTKSCFEDGVWGIFGVEQQRESVTVRDVVSGINVNGYYIVSYKCYVTLLTAKNTKLLQCVRVRARITRYYDGFLPCLAIARCCASSFS